MSAWPLMPINVVTWWSHRRRGAGPPCTTALMEAREAGEQPLYRMQQDSPAARAERRSQQIKDALNRRQCAEVQLKQLVDAGLGSLVLLPGLQSNRRQPGCQTRRIEEGAATKLKICEYMKATRSRFASQREWQLHCCQIYGRQWRSLQRVLDGEEQWALMVKSLHVGKGPGSKGKRSLRKGGLGARRSGGGRSDKFKGIKKRVQVWLEKERSHCHTVDKQDVLGEFLNACADEVDCGEKQLSKRRKLLETKQDSTPEEAQQKHGETESAAAKALRNLSEGNADVEAAPGYEDLYDPEEALMRMNDEELNSWMQKVKDRTERLKHPKYAQSFADRLLRDVGGK
eukprot:7465798-Karenia_brevis.AAC.1